MTTYYRIQTWSNGFSSDLYETFDDACDAIKEDMKSYPENDKLEIITATREEKLKYIQEWKAILYYKNSSGRKFHIVMMKVVPKKTKKHVYQYFVENSQREIVCSSDKYATFDEACDAMDKELSELYEIDGKEPLQRNRLVIKTLLEKSSSITYAYYNDGGSTTDKYVLTRQEA